MNNIEESGAEHLSAVLLRDRIVSAQDLAGALGEWQRRKDAGRPILLHQVLFRRKSLMVEDLVRLLKKGNSHLLGCLGCGRTLVGGDGSGQVCRECGMNYELIEVTSSLKNVETVREGKPTQSRERTIPARIGHYEPQWVLGMGAVGEVYLARDPKHDRSVALKVLRFDRDDEILIKRFEREARLLSSLKHEHIVEVVDFDMRSQPPFLVLEYLEGHNFDSYLAGSFDRVEAVEIIRGIASGVGAAHDQGVVHRDLKPANVLLDGKQSPQVTDFGLAKEIDSSTVLTQMGQKIGTPSYMSPEQLEGEMERVGPASDVYALGIMLYYSLRGRLPHQGRTPLEAVRFILGQDGYEPGGEESRVDSGLARVCFHATRHSPEDRYADGGEFEQAISLAQQGEAEMESLAPVGRKHTRWWSSLRKRFRKE